MAEALKNCYNEHFLQSFVTDMTKIVPDFDGNSFRRKVFTDSWEDLELKQRMNHLAMVLKQHSPKDDEIAMNNLLRFVDLQVLKKDNAFNFEYLFLPEYLLLLTDLSLDQKLAAVEKITQFTSCEFVIRILMLEYGTVVCDKMLEWTKHEHPYVRRLASEGMRTRLPWAVKVPVLFKQKERIEEICHLLIDDSSAWVRKSVSNSLNDLSKDFPEITLAFTKKWLPKAKLAQRDLKHGNRTLLKAGNPKALSLFGIEALGDKISIDHRLIKNNVKIGERLYFDVEIKNLSTDKIPLRVEYRLSFLRSNGSYHKKTFKISEKMLDGETILISKAHDFKIITTRKYYPGRHLLSILVNGEESKALDFELLS